MILMRMTEMMLLTSLVMKFFRAPGKQCLAVFVESYCERSLSPSGNNGFFFGHCKIRPYMAPMPGCKLSWNGELSSVPSLTVRFSKEDKPDKKLPRLSRSLILWDYKVFTTICGFILNHRCLVANTRRIVHKGSRCILLMSTDLCSFV